MKVLGTGLVCTRGRGADAAAGEWQPPTFIEVPFQNEPFPVYAVPEDALKDRAVLGAMRRADRFSKMVALAAHDAARGIAFEKPERVGIVFATGFGPHTTTFRFLDDILNYGDAGVSPTVFSGSVHNAAVSYVSQLLKIKGPTWTITRFRNPFEEAMALAQTWLDEGRCDQVLLGGGDECGTVMEYIFREKLPVAADGRIGKEAYVPGEGAAFFLVDNGEGGAKLEIPSADLTPQFGNMPVAAALNCAIGQLRR